MAKVNFSLYKRLFQSLVSKIWNREFLSWVVGFVLVGFIVGGLGNLFLLLGALLGVLSVIRLCFEWANGDIYFQRKVPALIVACSFLIALGMVLKKYVGL